MNITYSPQDPFPKDGFIVDEQFPSEDDYTDLKLSVFGQYSAERYQPASGREVCISITARNDPSFGVGRAKLSGMFLDVLHLQFDDVAVGSADHERATSITPDEARKVVEFVNKHRDASRLVIHCFAGMSRSRSMASAIADYLNLPYDFTVLNPHVYDSVVDAFVELDETLSPSNSV